jgi:hypothetical protein
MSTLDLQRLYKIRQTRQNYESYEYRNGSISKNAASEKKKIADHFVAKANEVQRKIDDHIGNICKKKCVLPIGILSVLLCVIIIVGAFSFFQPFMSFNSDAVIEAYDKAIANNNDLLPSGMQKTYEYAFHTEPNFTITEEKIEENKQSYYEWLTGETYTCLIGNAILFLIIHAILMAVGSNNKNSGLICIPITVVIIFNIIMIIVFFVKAIVAVGFFNALFGGLFATIGAIPFIFHAGYTFWLAPLLVAIISVAFACLSEFLCKNITKDCMAKDATVLELSKEKKEYLRKSKDNAKAAYDKIMATKKENPYTREFNAIRESYLTTGNELYDIIWALENHYAHDIVGARQFLDQRRRDAAIAAQLAKNTEAINRQAKAQMAQAQATQALANRPVEVKVEVTEYYY